MPTPSSKYQRISFFVSSFKPLNLTPFLIQTSHSESGQPTPQHIVRPTMILIDSPFLLLVSTYHSQTVVLPQSDQYHEGFLILVSSNNPQRIVLLY